MANNRIRAIGITSGSTVYGLLVGDGDLIWNVTTSGWEGLNGANLSQYAISMGERNTTGWFFGDLPAGLAAGNYNAVACVRQSGSPAWSDPCFPASIDWTGSAIGYAGGPVASVMDRTGFKLAADGVDAVIVEAAVGDRLAVNIRQSLSVILAAASGVITGQEQFAPILCAPDATTPRISATTDVNGNRLSTVLNVPA